MTTEAAEEHRGGERALLWSTVIVLGLAVVMVVFMALDRRHKLASEAKHRDEQVSAGPKVMVVPARKAPPTRTLDLQGEVRPYLQTVLYAKLAGFLDQILVDKGDRVHDGQVIGHIQAPEVERQVQAARANALNLRDIAKRYRTLASKDFVSIQDSEIATANARVAKANQRQIEATQDYAILRAPFDGVVVARYADPGAYLAAGGAPVVAVARNDLLRIYAYVDQANAMHVQVGDTAKIHFPGERDARAAKVTRIAGALDPRTRMLQVEMQLHNKGELVPGGFADVQLTVEQPPGMIVPADALTVRGDKTFVGVVDGEQRLRQHPVDVLQSDGKTALIGNGLQEGDKVAIGAGETIAEGGKVQPVEQPAKKPN
jgi:RND family efflux transporter MFP subunit